MKRIRKLLRQHWKYILCLIGAGVLTVSALLFRLSSLAPVLSPDEQATVAQASHLHNIVTNPIDLPIKLLEWPLRFAPHQHIVLFSRLPSVALAVISLIIFAYILRRWYGPRTTVFGFIIFVLSAWFLHVGRFAGTDIEYIAGILALLAIHIGLYDHDDRPLVVYIWLVTNLLLLFIPGFIWFIFLSLIWQKTEIVTAWQKLGPLWNRILWSILAIGGVAGSLYSIVRTLPHIKPWLGAPEAFGTWQTVIHQLGNTVGAFVYHGPHNPELWLGELPVLDVLAMVMLIAGIAFYIRHWHASRTRLLLGYTILGIILVSLNGPVRLSVIVPIVYLVVIGGIAYVLHFWLSLFPRNPLARAFGMTLLVTVITLSCTYNVEQYFLAWPHNEEVTKVYQQSSP